MYIAATGGPFQSPPPSRIAADLEAAAERGQFGKGGVTSGARLSGLAGVARQGLGGTDAAREAPPPLIASAARPTMETSASRGVMSLDLLAAVFTGVPRCRRLTRNARSAYGAGAESINH